MVPWQFGHAKEWKTVTMQQRQPIPGIHNILEENIKKTLYFKPFNIGLGLLVIGFTTKRWKHPILLTWTMPYQLKLKFKQGERPLLIHLLLLIVPSGGQGAPEREVDGFQMKKLKTLVPCQKLQSSLECLTTKIVAPPLTSWVAHMTLQ